MELIITEKEPLTTSELTICLNMIVKDESHIIKNTLEKLCSKIKFSYWVICDTGSSDNTKEIITDFFKEKNIIGELYTDEWKNFAHNRTLALQRAFAKTDLLLVFDADDEIVGDIVMPGVNDAIYDEYHLKFGSSLGIAYTRVLLVNNHKRFIYQSVIHEYICCVEASGSGSTVVNGNYYVVSGRTGNRNQDPLKYLKDAKVLEAAHAEALKNNDPLYRRYSFYCANSYKDHGSFEDAIRWYKITLSQDNWEQEQYISCLYAYECYLKINQPETGFFYLVKAFKYDPERLECLYPLLVHYCCDGQNRVAYNYYLNVKDYFENRYLNTNMDRKLFVTIDKYNFFVPYYMIIIADKVKDYNCVVKMYEIVFMKKQPIYEEWYIKNFLFNLQFFVQHVKPENKSQFTELANEYIRFLHGIKIKLHTFDCLKDYDSRFGLDISYIFNKSVAENKMLFSKEECETSKNILFYTGFADVDWNYSYMQSNALGGSEKAVAYLSKEIATFLLDKDYKIYVAGVVGAESFDNVTYVSFQDIPTLIKKVPFHTVICSRYIAFLEMFKECSFHQFYIWAHDTMLLPYGCNLTDKEIITKWDKYITGCICQTDWHSNLFKGLYPELTNKINIINNGLSVTTEKDVKINKQSNKFIYSSRPERGLETLLKLWPQIIDVLPDAELVISSYGPISDQSILDLIQKYESVKYLGKLNTEQLYDEMKSAEYWLYPTAWPETSCITALEMLMSEVICLYYPVAALPYTIKDHGIQVKSGNEIETLINLTETDKVKLRENGRKYALTCSWENRAKEWSNVLFENEKINIISSEFDHLYDNKIYEVTQFNKEQTVKFKIYNNCYICYTSIKLNKIWEPEFHEIFEKYITPESIVIEGGTHIGIHTIKLAMLAKKVYAFEPLPSSNNLLNININLNNLKNVITIKKGLSNEVGFTHFAWSLEYNPGGSGLANNPLGVPNCKSSSKNKINVELTTIDLLNLDRLDFIKLDIEGYEELAIKGGMNTIVKFKPVILMECYKNHSGGVMSIDELKEKYHLLIDIGYNVKQINHSDFLFENEKIDYINTNNNFKINIINLNRRPDRKEKMINEMKLKGIKNYEFVEAIDGKKIEPSIFIKNLFKGNDFNYRKGVIGCALSHYSLWHKLVHDNLNNYYIILEDDISIVENFNEKLQTCIDIIRKNNIEYALIGGNHIPNDPSNNTKIIFDKIIDPDCNGTYGYIISRSACYKLINNIQQNGIKYAIDYSGIYTNCLDMYKINYYLVTTQAFQLHNNTDTDIQTDYDYLNFDSIPSYSIAFTDWWTDEYCGGKFNFENNFFKNLLSNFYNINVIKPEDNPDILFYSIFGNNHRCIASKRKIFYSGEAISQKNDADFNITFDENSDKNCRLPLWICYIDNVLFDDCYQKNNSLFKIPNKTKFCSIICQQDNKNKERSEIVNKLSKYKKVDCGGSLLNNIGYIVPRGVNCSGKIEHNNNYKFVLAFENTNYPGYVTEKICDAYKSRCIPIYWGSNEVINDFNPKTFINANDFSTFDELVKYIEKVDTNQALYESYFVEPIFSDYWLNIFSDIKQIFYSNLASKITNNKNTKLIF